MTVFEAARLLAGSIGEGYEGPHYRLALIEWIKGIRKRGSINDSSDVRALRAWTRRSTLQRHRWVEAFNVIMDDDQEISVTQCLHCHNAIFMGGGWSHIVSDDGEMVCGECFAYYTECATCGRFAHRDHVIRVHDYGSICNNCYESGSPDVASCSACSYYFLTENMYYDENNDVHYCDEHAPRSGCRPQHMEFEFPALCTPQKTIREDEIVPITVGRGDVSEEGMRLIHGMIYTKTSGKYGYGGISLDEIINADLYDRSWQTKEGNFPKRLAKHLLIEHSMKLNEDVMTEIGNIAKAHAAIPGTHYVSLTRDLNLSADEFINEGSCWWGSESHSRCELKAYYGFGVRTWSTPNGNQDGGHPVSRAWLVPLTVTTGGPGPKFAATHVLPADAYVLFNAYEIDQLPYARMIAGMTGKSYRKLKMFDMSAYINAAGILIAEQSICDATDRVALPMRRECGAKCRVGG